MYALLLYKRFNIMRVFLVTWFICSISIAQAQSSTEICDNGIDDDGDGRIDLLDADCDCAQLSPPSLIPNPSFEDTLCCPNNRSQMNCAETWIQASEATTDLLHSCGWMGWEGLAPPLPFPDGQSCLGFRNGAFDATFNLPNWKEYAGACLLEPLQPGVVYKFQFYLGFVNYVNSPAIDITFFGTEDCDYLPFGVGNDELGCPTNGANWYKLGSTTVRGSGEWVLVEITAIPDRKIEAIAIGPDCRKHNYTQPTYYFLDNLTLNAASAFGFEIEASDQLCAEGVSLSVLDLPDLEYQWYKDGIALVGEERANLSKLHGRGRYQVRTTNPNGLCGISVPFPFFPPQAFHQIDTVICENEAYWFDGQVLDQKGVYVDTLKTQENCDSIVTLNLDLFVNQPKVQKVKVWPGEQIFVGPARLSEPGWHEVEMVSRSGCDSTAIVELKFFRFFAPSAFSPNGDGVNDRFFIQGGEDVEHVRFQVFNRWGQMVFTGEGQAPDQGWDGQSAPEGVYMYRAEVRFSDGITRERAGSITLLR